MEEARQGCSVLVLLLLSFSPLVLFVVGAALLKCREQVQAMKQVRARSRAKAMAEAKAAVNARRLARNKTDMDLHMTAWDTRSAPAASMASRLTPAALAEDAGHSHSEPLDERHEEELLQQALAASQRLSASAAAPGGRNGAAPTTKIPMASVMPAALATRTVAMRVPPGMGPVLRP